jgi:lysophospholipase L1-like esterase
LFGALSGTVRSAFLLVSTRTIARIWPPDYVFVGDSLIENCRWRGRLSWNPIAVVNLAIGGTVIRQIVPQVGEAKKLGAKHVLISAGINDLLLDHAPQGRIEFDFDLLLRGLGRNQHAIVTLIPYTADAALSARIDAINESIRRLAERWGLTVVDLNPFLSDNRTRKPEMTNDGVHFTDRACAIWLWKIRENLN